MQFCFVIIPIIQVFFLYFGTVTTKVWLRLSVLWDFFNFYTLLLIVLIANLVVLLIMIFEFATLVTPRIINFRLATASASLRLMRSLRIYYSMLWGALLQLTALYVLFSYTAISLHYVPFSQLCMCSSCILYYQ